MQRSRARAVQLHRQNSLHLYSLTCIYTVVCVCVLCAFITVAARTSHRCSGGFVGFFVFRGSRFPRRGCCSCTGGGAHTVRGKGKVRASGSGVCRAFRKLFSFYPCTLHIIVNNKRDYAGGNPYNIGSLCIIYSA